jgi:hypothetical protein
MALFANLERTKEALHTSVELYIDFSYQPGMRNRCDERHAVGGIHGALLEDQKTTLGSLLAGLWGGLQSGARDLTKGRLGSCGRRSATLGLGELVAVLYARARASVWRESCGFETSRRSRGSLDGA